MRVYLQLMIKTRGFRVEFVIAYFVMMRSFMLASLFDGLANRKTQP